MALSIDAFSVDCMPESCPVCHHAVLAIHLPNTALRHAEFPRGGEVMSSAFRCPRPNCRAIFIGYYDSPTTQNILFRLKSVAPKRYAPPHLDSRIQKISPQFVVIYGQALTAGSLGLNEVHGVGLRKALEFLIKDYCMVNRPTESTEIKKTFLGNCISTYVTDPNIKTCAQRAVWLGNDETHYSRQWTTHDITDLERLITLTCNWIVNEQLTLEYTSSMASSPKP